jgi:prevent-host-death family protein
MTIVNLYDAKTQLSKLVDQAAGGQDVVIARNGKPVARLTTLSEKKPIRYGILKGKVEVAEDFDAPLPEDVIEKFEGR